MASYCDVTMAHCCHGYLGTHDVEVGAPLSSSFSDPRVSTRGIASNILLLELGIPAIIMKYILPDVMMDSFKELGTSKFVRVVKLFTLRAELICNQNTSFQSSPFLLCVIVSSVDTDIANTSTVIMIHASTCDGRHVNI